MFRPSPKRLRLISLVTLAAVIAGCLPGGGSGSSSARLSGKPNMIVIIADDLGYADLSAFGSEISTPNIDSLTRDGRLLTNFHTTPLCATTRANLLTGADHHLVGLGRMSDTVQPWQRNQPGYEGFFTDKARTVAQLLKDAGYHTFQAGKWHLGEDGPTAWGFERAFSLKGDLSHANNFTAPAGRTNSADPVWLEDGKTVEVPEGVFSTDLYVDKLIEYIGGRRDGRPFFAYFAPQATHWPLQAPDSYLDRYKGVYDAGYEVIREQRLARQKALGIIPQDFTPAPAIGPEVQNLSMPGNVVTRPWSQLTPPERQREARAMEVYAAMVTNLDDNVGRLIQQLKRTGEYDNTAIVFLADNGADGFGYPLPVQGFVDNSLANYGKQGSFVILGAKWGEVGSTPFRLFKGFSTEGGTTVPTIVRVPGVTEGGGKLHAFGSALDIAPTLLELAGIADPGSTYQGRSVAPLEGRSLLPALRDPAQRVHRDSDVLVGEVYNHRSVREGDWKLVRIDPGPAGNGALLNHDWQLFNLANDRIEQVPLASRGVNPVTAGNASGTPEHVAILDRLIGHWNAYKARVGVALPPGQQ